MCGKSKSPKLPKIQPPPPPPPVQPAVQDAVKVSDIDDKHNQRRGMGGMAQASESELTGNEGVDLMKLRRGKSTLLGGGTDAAA